MQGVDLDQEVNKGSLIFVDGLTGLFAPAPESPHAGRRILRSAKLADVRSELERAVADAQSKSPSGAAQRETILILDQVDCYLALTSSQNTPVQVLDLLASLREVHILFDPSHLPRTFV